MARASGTFGVGGPKADEDKGTGDSNNLRPSHGKRMSYELQTISVKPLSASPSFARVCAVFCVVRLVRPLLLVAYFSDGPHTDDMLAVPANAFAWAVPALGLIAAVLLRTSFELPAFVLRCLPAPLERNMHPELLASWLLVIAVHIDALHFAVSLTRASFFWSSGIVSEVQLNRLPTNEAHARQLLAYLLAALHALSLLGTSILVLKYWRSFRVSWQGEGACRVVHAADAGAGSGPTAKFRGRNLRSHEAAYIDAFADLEASGARANLDSKADDFSSAKAGAAAAVAAAAVAAARTRMGGDRWDEEGDSQASCHGTEFGQRKTCQAQPRTSTTRPPPKEGDAAGGAAKATADPEDFSSGSFDQSASSSPPRSGLSTPPRAWLWAGDEWLPVRIIRSSADGFCTVRIPGGNIMQTRPSLLRSRDAGSGPPPPPPGPEGAGAGGGEGGTRERGKCTSRHATGNASASTGDASGSRRNNTSDGGGSSAVSAAATAATPPPQASDGEKWAVSRMDRLRKELIELDKRELSERKKGLRRLQRELHPDKLSPELRVHAQPLFHMVQREWEVTMAGASSAHDDFVE
eukprot:TRINITY_DN67590_c0_g1_i1.p1 TRINITY_DN67590_c0_g1~~TRINITY_DN67590_c0_g1_i1.p1  ORF type:complete len:579 (+),score=87.91 TRINITY_DN67590_c0_g1_i1:50-1786(+)